MLLGIRWGSLRIKIIAWFFVPTMIVLVAVAIVIFYAYRDVTEDLVIERNQELVRLAASQLLGELGEYTDLLDDETRISDIYGNEPSVQRAALKRASNRLAVFDAGVLILDTFGTVVAAEPERPEALGQDWSDRAYYRQILRSQTTGPVFSDVVADGPGGADVIVVAVPILGPRGEFVGAIAGMFRVSTTTVSAFYGDIVKLRLGKNGSAYLVDGQGWVIYHSDPNRIGDDLSTQEMVQRVMSGELGGVRALNLDGREIVASFAPVPDTSWGLVTEEDWTMLISAGQSYRRFLLSLLALGVLMPAMVVAVGVRRITRPITGLIGAAQEVAGGNFSQMITAPTGDEIEELAEQFNLMAAQLQETYTHLEQRVADRTKELTTLNAIATTVSQSLHLDEILNDALDKTLQAMNIEAGGIYLLDEGTKVLTVAAHRGFSLQFVTEIDNLKVGEGLSGYVAQSGEPMVLRDVSADPRLTRMAVREEGLRSLAIVPLSSRGKVLGTLFAVTRGYREFTDQDIQLLSSIGHQIGVAIENGRLFETEQRRAEQFRVMSQVGRQITSILDIDELLEQIARLVKETFDYYAVGTGLVEGDEVVFRAGAGAFWDETQLHRSLRLKVGQEGFTGWVAQSGEPLLVPDVSQDPRYYQVPETSETRSEMTVPLKIKGSVIGILGVQSDRLNAFDESDLVMLQSLANQAAVVIENARLFEAEQRRAEQFRVIGEVGRRIASTLAIDELLDQMVDLIQEAFDYYLVEIGLVEQGEIVFKARAGRDWDSPFESFRLQVDEQSITGWVAATGRPLLVPDVSQEPRYVKVTDTETRSELVVPIRTQERITGVINVESDRLDAFDMSDVAVLQSLAHQAAIAIENARLFEAEQRRAEQFRVISEVGRHITSILDVDELLGEIIRLLKETFGYYLITIGLIEGDEVVFKAGVKTRWHEPQFRPPPTKLGGRGITAWVATTGEPLLAPDVDKEPRYLFWPDVAETRSELAVPLKTKAGGIIGVLNVESDQLNAFDESDVQVLQSLANQAAIAIENARLYEQAQQLAALKERERLARELHDAVTQTLFSASLIAEVLPRTWELDSDEGHRQLEEVRVLTRGALAEMRTLLLELRPEALSRSNMSDLLRQLGRAMTGRTGVPVEISVEDKWLLPPSVQIALYRIAQEALNNAGKHANASRVDVHFTCEPGQATLAICDDGQGFDMGSIPPGHFGVGIMQERAESIGTVLEITSQPGAGTRVMVNWQEQTKE